MKRHRIIAAVLATLLVMTGLAVSSATPALADHVPVPNAPAQFVISKPAGAGNPSTETYTPTPTGLTASSGVILNNNFALAANSAANGSIQSNGDFTITTPGAISGTHPTASIALGAGTPANRTQTIAFVGGITGNLNPHTGAMTMSFTIRHQFNVGTSNTNCGTQYPVTLTTGTSGALTGTPYNARTGLVTLVANDYPVPVVSGGTCVSPNTTNTNTALGLPRANGASSMSLTFSLPTTALRPNGDLAVTQSNSGLNPGLPLTKTINVQNVGPQPSTGPFTVTDTLPTGLTYTGFTGAGWSCNNVGQAVTCTFGDNTTHLANTAFISPALQIHTDTATTAFPSVSNTATVTGPANAAGFQNEDWQLANSTSTATITAVSPNVAITKTHTGNFTINKPETYTLTVSNTATAPTVNTVTVTDTLPSRLTPQSATGDGWSCNVAGQVVTCTRPSVAQSSTAPPITLTVVPNGTTDASVVNSATVQTERDNGVTGNNLAQDTTLIRRVDLAIAKQSTPALFTVGQDSSYTLTVSNPGSAPTFGDVTVTDVLDEDTRALSVDGTGWSCDVAEDENIETVTCTRPSMAAGETAPPITITLDVLGSAVPQVTNLASVATTGDVNAANNSLSLDTEVRIPLPDIRVVQSTNGPIVVGGIAERHFTVDNHGTGPTTGPITVQHTIPQGFTFQSVSGTGWTCSNFVVSGSTIVRCVYAASVAKGETAPDIVLNLNVLPTAFPSKSSTVTAATDTEHATLLADNSNTATLTVNVIDLKITKTASDLRVGETGTYTLAVQNVGTGTSSHPATVTDLLPTGTQYVSHTGSDWTCEVEEVTSRDEVTCTAAAGLAPGASYTNLVITVAIGDAAHPSVSNTAEVETQHELNLANNSSSTTTTVRAPDLSITKTASDLRVGVPGTFTIAVSNVGNDQTSGNTVVSDLLPVGTHLTGHSGTGWACISVDDDGQDQVTCTNSGTVAGGASYAPLVLDVSVSTAASPSVTNTATVSAARDQNEANDTDDVTQTVRAGDLKITKVLDGVFTTGYDASFTIQVSNIGNDDSVGPTTVVDELPFGLTYTGYSGAGWTCGSVVNMDGSQTITCTNPSNVLAGGQLAPLVLDVHVDAVPGDYENTADVTDSVLSARDPALANNSVTIPVTVFTPLVDLEIDKSSADQFVYGADGEYTLQVTNVGRAVNTGPITVTDTLPDGLTLDAVSGLGWSCDPEGDAFECTTNASLLPNGGAANPITVDVSIGAAAFPEVSNTADVSTANDPNPENDEDTDTRSVTAADYTIDKSASAFNLGNQGTFTIVVSNEGGADSTGGVTVTDTLPAGLSYVSGTGTNWVCNSAGQAVTCNTPDTIGAGDSYPAITITVNTGEAAHPGFTNTASVAGPLDIDTEDNSDDAIVTTTRPDLAITKSGAGSMNVGDQSTYTISVQNVGTGATSGTVTVTDELPAGLTYVSATGTGWSCSAVGQDVTCTRNNALAAGASYPSITLTVDVGTEAWDETTNTADVDGAFDNNSSNDSSSSTRAVTAPDMTITKTHEGFFTVGTTGVWHVTITNDGTAPTVGTITTNDLLPEGITYNNNNGPVACLPLDLGTRQLVTCATADVLMPGDSEEFDLIVDVALDASPGVVNTITVVAERDPNPANDEASDEVFVALPSGDLTVTKSHPADFVVGMANEYQYDVSNVGTFSTLGSVTVTDTLPAGLTPQMGSGTGWGCMTFGQSFGCTHPGPLDPGDDLPTLTVPVTAEMAAVPSADSEATVTTAGDPVTSNNTDDDPTTVKYVDLAMNKAVAGGAPVPGSPTSYDLTVTNVGTAATDAPLLVVDILPSVLTGATASGTDWSCGTTTVAGTTSVVCTRSASLAAGASSVISLTANLAASATGNLVNGASVSNLHDPLTGNDTSTSTVDLGNTPGPVVVPPGAPTLNSVTAGDGTLTLNFTAPASNGGAPITNYEYSLDGGSTWVTPDPAVTASPIELTGLPNGVTQLVAVRAVNSAGPSAQSTVKSARPQTTPSVVQDLAIQVQNGAAKVSWSPPASDGGLPITQYKVTSSPDGKSCSTDSSGRSCVVSDLRNGVLYTFTVRATTEVGQSPAVTIQGTPRTTPTAPRSVTAVAGDRSATLSWAKPLSTGGSAITEYKVRCVPRQLGLRTRRATVTGDLKTVEVTRLRNGVAYDCYVRALNVAGSSPWSSAAVVRPLA